MNRALAFTVALAALLVILLATASANSDLFGRHYALLLFANALAAILLLGLVFVRISTLLREYRAQVFGSRLKWRLVVMLGLMAVLPGALLYAVSMQFAVKSIDSWFNVHVEVALKDGLKLGRGVLDSQRNELLARVRSMAQNLGAHTSAARLNSLRERADADTAAVYTAAAQLIAGSTAKQAQLMPPPTVERLLQAGTEPGLAWVDVDNSSGNDSAESEGGKLYLRAISPLSVHANGETQYLQLTRMVSPLIAQSAQSIAAAQRDYQELQLGRSGIKSIYTLTLTFTLLLALFAALGLAFFLAERLARPLLMLAEGTQAVAAGDFTPRAALPSHDELGTLTQSFSRMTQQLQEARHDAEEHRSQLEATSAYLESVLTNMSAGVLAFDNDLTLAALNRGAVAILGEDVNKLARLPLTNWPFHREFAEFTVEQFAQTENGEWQEQLHIERSLGPGDSGQTLLLRGSKLPQNGGYVVVFDDISHLVAAQRTAAWAEVAQRLAHEIKNPLMPIQLSAERLHSKLHERLAPPERALLERATRTIVGQVEALKNMVNEFRDYARTPPPNLQAVDLNTLTREVLALYEGANLTLKLRLATDLPQVMADANQLRQIMHNLIKNAREAQSERPTALIEIATRSDGARFAVWSIADGGAGFSAQTLARACEPYVTTKHKGTGLGLAIVKKIIDEHHGEISIQNRPDGGAEVTLKLPLWAGEENL